MVFTINGPEKYLVGPDIYYLCVNQYVCINRRLIKKPEQYICPGFHMEFLSNYPFNASAPPTISRISFVMAA
jgi:hypothetical protein